MTYFSVHQFEYSFEVTLPACEFPYATINAPQLDESVGKA
jgi:hypothetical protein